MTLLSYLHCTPSKSFPFRVFRYHLISAHKLFDGSSQRNATTYINHSISESLRKNSPSQALAIFTKNLQLGLSGRNIVNEVTLCLALKACRGDTKLGCQVHGFSITSGFTSFVCVSNAVMGMYRKAGRFDNALCIFESLVDPDVVSWNTILSGFDEDQVAMSFVVRMRSAGVVFDAFTYSTALSFCVGFEGFSLGLQLHSIVVKTGLESDVVVGNSFITMYSRGGSFRDARRVFDEKVVKDMITWNSLLSGLSQGGNLGFEAVLVFREMMRQGVELDHVSFTSVITTCCHENDLKIARQIHGLCLKRGYATLVSVGNMLMTSYWKCGVVEAARSVFYEMSERNVISWTTMISANKDDAVSIFHKMRLDGVFPNEVTFIGLINAVKCNEQIKEGVKMHGICIKTGFASKPSIGNSFITMYAKFEALEDAKKAFDEINVKEIISWNAMISGFAQNGFSLEALKMYLSAAAEATPNEYTFGSVLNAIASAENISLRHGQRCHAHILKLGLNSCPVVSSALLDMYAKRGSIDESEKVFDEMSEKNQFVWTSIISAYSSHGDFESVMSSFQEMVNQNIAPDLITFLSVLTACNRKGMVDKGYEIFSSMTKDYCLEPSHEHYSCMVDMLGRAGRLKEAEELMIEVPGGPGVSMLQSMLGSCRLHGNSKIGEKVAELVMEMEPKLSGSYVQMYNIHAEMGQWEKAAEIRRRMRKKDVKKEIGTSWVDFIDSEGSLTTIGFSSGDKSHPKSDEIYGMVETLGLEMDLEEEVARSGLLFRVV
ncbi:pentatricopeptide repeat-containing protein At4g32430, mitochondrial isoform X1 [Brassica rapa]|uniref:pentatricopeptide repeat-containing protein At4g32430, mitochondrial isoform X1 n=1 Tax=Brassica campestris TaxID=3711 RepID=UPI00142D6482|nr:pentatricopeptide repeat-containing protein At4g32430, mitochondrial isoform X1 [Brassica rapa]